MLSVAPPQDIILPIVIADDYNNIVDLPEPSTRKKRDRLSDPMEEEDDDQYQPPATKKKAKKRLSTVAYFEDQIDEQKMSEKFVEAQRQLQCRRKIVIPEIIKLWDEFLALHNVILNHFKTPFVPGVVDANQPQTSNPFERLHMLYIAVLNKIDYYYVGTIAEIEHKVLFSARLELILSSTLIERCESTLGIPSVNRAEFETRYMNLKFHKNACKLVKGLTPNSFCRGLIKFLQSHMMWQDNAKCEEWIESVQRSINMAYFSSSRDSTAAKRKSAQSNSYWNEKQVEAELKSLTGPVQRPFSDNYVHAGQWIRARAR